MNQIHSRTGSQGALTDVGALGLAVRQARKAHGLTQAELAGLAGPGPRFISELERGKPGAELGKVLDVLAVLGLRLLLAGAEGCSSGWRSSCSGSRWGAGRSPASCAGRRTGRTEERRVGKAWSSSCRSLW